MDKVADPRYIIGFGARAQVGKDYAFKVLQNRGWSVFRGAFADALKRDVAPILANVDIDIWHLKDKEEKEIARELQVCVAHRVIRRRDPNYWIKRFFKDLIWEKSILVVTDVRYANETRAIQDRGGFVVHITPPSTVPYINDEEKQNDPQVREMANAHVTNEFNVDYEEEVEQVLMAYLRLKGVSDPETLRTGVPVVASLVKQKYRSVDLKKVEDLRTQLEETNSKISRFQGQRELKQAQLDELLKKHSCKSVDELRKKKEKAEQAATALEKEITDYLATTAPKLAALDTLLAS